MKKCLDRSKFLLLMFFAIAIVLSCLLPQIIYVAKAMTKGEEMIQKTMKNSHISIVSAASISGNNETFFSFGDSVDENSLFCIGSLSKTFTGYAVLYLEENGQLALEDSITKYIPWFESMYEGKNVADSITIADLLYQTSGFTNSEKQFPSADTNMNLADNIKNLSGRELSFFPSKQFAYANANYNLLGYIIEQVTDSSYSDFMASEIFIPLGLTSTFASPSNFGGKLVAGTRLSFFRAWNYDSSISEGAVPAGYIISSSKDLSRWLQIHLGIIEVPPIYATVTQKSHKGNTNSVIDDNTCYAAGWYVNNDDGRIYHSGGTPNYSSRLVIDMKNTNAACVLTNMNASANTDDMADNLIHLLQGNIEMKYRQDIWTIMDTIFSIISVVCLILVILVIILTMKKWKSGKQMSKAWYILPVLAMFLTIACIFFLPLIFVSPWSVIIVWAPYSIVVGIASLSLLAVLLFFSILIARKKYATKKLVDNNDTKMWLG